MFGNDTGGQNVMEGRSSLEVPLECPSWRGSLDLGLGTDIDTEGGDGLIMYQAPYNEPKTPPAGEITTSANHSTQT